MLDLAGHPGKVLIIGIPVIEIDLKMFSSDRPIRHLLLRSLAVSTMAIVLSVGSTPFGQLAGLSPTTVLACSGPSCIGGDQTSGSANGTGVNGNGTAPSPPSSGASSYWYCSYGYGSWKLPLNTTVSPPVVKSQTSTVLTESLPYNSIATAAAYWQWHLDAFNNFFYGVGKGGFTQNSASFFWENGFADMLASDLMIEPISANAGNNWTGNPAGGSILHLRTEAARTALMNKQVLNVRTGPDASWWNGYAHTASPASYFTVRSVNTHFGAEVEISLTVPGSSTARVWSPGTEPTIGGTGFLSPTAIKNMVASHFHDADLAYYIPQNYDKNGNPSYNNAKSYVVNARKPGVTYVPGYPYEILIKRPGDAKFTVWSAAKLGSTAFPAGTLYNVQVVMPAHSAIYSGATVQASLDLVHTAFNQVVKAQMGVKWNQTNNYRSDLSGSFGPGQRGHAFYPAFAYPFYFNGSSSRPATRAEANGSIGASVCGADSIGFFGMTFSRDRTTNPVCKTAFVDSSSLYKKDVTRPDTCWTWWVYQQVPPPSISKSSWDAAINRTFSPVPLKPSSSAVLVNQSVTMSPSAVPPDAINFSLNDPNLNEVVTYNLTQLGITVSLGSTILKTIPLDVANPKAGYTFNLSFAETPLAHLQDPACAAATSAANLLARCGIVFKYDSVSKRVQPFYRISVQTWWGGEYHAAARGYCPLFSASCSNIDPTYAYRISAWSSAFNPTPLANNGKALGGGWQSFTSFNPDAPIYNAGYNPATSSTPVSLDISVGQSQPEQIP